MIKKILSLLFFVLPICSFSQKYVDLFTVNYGTSVPTAFENLSKTTSISAFETNLTLPIVLNNKLAIITGIDYSNTTLQLFPDSNFNHLHLTRLKAGIKITHSDTWSSTYLLLPKLASDYTNIRSSDFYLGGLMVFKYTKNKNLNYKFGIYASKEAYGLYTTPLLGLYYSSPNSDFEMNLTLPSYLDMNYSLTQTFKVGLEYNAQGKSFSIHQEAKIPSYVENNSLEFSTYLQNNSIHKNVLLRLKLGYTINRFEVYPIDQKIDLTLSAFRFGDSRTQLNTNLLGSAFFKMEAIYRFDLIASSKNND